MHGLWLACMYLGSLINRCEGTGLWLYYIILGLFFNSVGKDSSLKAGSNTMLRMLAFEKRLNTLGIKPRSSDYIQAKQSFLVCELVLNLQITLKGFF